MAEITIEVGALHADLHEQLSSMLGEQYEAQTRNEMESLIHETYQQVERMQEQEQNQIEQKADEEPVEEDE